MEFQLLIHNDVNLNGLTAISSGRDMTQKVQEMIKRAYSSKKETILPVPDPGRPAGIRAKNSQEKFLVGRRL